MEKAIRYLISTLAATVGFVVLNVACLAKSTCNDCVVHYGLPFTVYEYGAGWGFVVRRFIWSGAVGDLIAFVLVVVAVSLSWNRIPRTLSVLLAFLALCCGVGAGFGAAVLYTHAFQKAGYSICFTVLAALASMALLRAAKERWRRGGAGASQQQPFVAA